MDARITQTANRMEMIYEKVHEMIEATSSSQANKNVVNARAHNNARYIKSTTKQFDYEQGTKKLIHTEWNRNPGTNTIRSSYQAVVSATRQVLNDIRPDMYDNMTGNTFSTFAKEDIDTMVTQLEAITGEKGHLPARLAAAAATAIEPAVAPNNDGAFNYNALTVEEDELETDQSGNGAATVAGPSRPTPLPPTVAGPSRTIVQATLYRSPAPPEVRSASNSNKRSRMM
ncbi:unnamed protein product [Absidia cylindrospora]